MEKATPPDHRDNELLDVLKTGFGLRSDAQVADFLGITRTTIHSVRHGRARLGILQRLKILDHIGFLHSRQWLENLLQAAQAHSTAAAFGSRQLCHENPNRLDGIGDCYHASGMAWRQGHGQPQQTRHLVAQEIFAPCAAAALYRRAAIMALDGFDESYFCYMEDVDLGFRLRLAGHSARYVPTAVVRHVGSATSGGQHSDFAVFHGHRNMVWTFVKNMPSPLLWLLLPWHLAANLAALVIFTARGQGKTILRAKWQALQGLKHAWRQRQTIQRQRSASTRSIWAALNKQLWPRPGN